MTQPKVRLALLSTAHMHSAPYLGNIKARPDTELVGIWDDDAARGRKAAEGSGTRYFADAGALLAEGLDAVVITSENIYHRSLVEQVCGSKSGAKVVMCEKPLATTAVDGQAMIDACRSRRNLPRHRVPMPLRAAAFQRALAVVSKRGRSAKILAIRGTNHGVCPFGWFVESDKSGGGAVIDHTVHVADVNRVLLGAEATEVYCETGNNIYHQTWEDCGFLTITYGDGVFATLDASWSRPQKSFHTWGDVTLEIVAEGGVLSVDMFNQGMTYYSEATGTNRSIGWGSDIDQGLIADLVRAGRGEETPMLASGEDGLRAAEVAFAAYESARTGQPVKTHPDRSSPPFPEEGKG